MSPHLLFTRRHDARGAVSPTMALSSLATLLSVAALVLAFLAYTKAGNVAVSTAAPSPSPTSPGSVTPTPTPAPSVTTEESSGNETTPPAAYTPGQPLPTPTGDYVGAYPDTVINLVPNTGQCTRPIDLDQPLVNATSDASDVQYYTCGTAAVLQFETPGLATFPSGSPTAGDCSHQIDLSPGDQKQILSQGLVICTVTNGVGAKNDAPHRKIARITVISVQSDNSAKISLTAWDLPS